VKTCIKCKISQSKDNFFKQAKSADGLFSYCKPCKNVNRRRYRASEKHKSDIWKAANHDKIKIYKQRDYIKNISTYKESHRNWRINNRGIRNSLEAARKSSKLKRTPKWLSKDDKKEIAHIYKVCAWLNSWKLEKYQVDHIVPIQGRTISGLHVPWNLQILTASENASKGNRI
jgi:hypothetical protein